MTEHPINLKAWEVRAIIDGRKTMTRRVLKPQPQEDIGLWLAKRKPARWIPGDRLWVRESHYLTDDGHKECVCYAADEEAVRSHIANIHLIQRNLCLPDSWAAPHLRKYSPAVMPCWASRITLLVTDVRVERVRNITSADAIAEGFRPYANSATIDCSTPDPRDDFIALLTHLHGPDAWERNDWVSVTKFERVT